MLYRSTCLKKKIVTDKHISDWLVKNESKIPRDKEVIIKIKNKFYKIRELG